MYIMLNNIEIRNIPSGLFVVEGLANSALGAKPWFPYSATFSKDRQNIFQKGKNVAHWIIKPLVRNVNKL